VCEKALLSRVLIAEEDDRRFFNARESFLGKVVEELLWFRVQDWIDALNIVPEEDAELNEHLNNLAAIVISSGKKSINLKDLPLMTRVYVVDRMCYEAFHSSKRNEFKRDITKTLNLDSCRPVPFGTDSFGRQYYDFKFGDCRICKLFT
jgi:hypothetical protein